jgi:hypothetical protein
MTLRCIWNYQSIDRRKSEKFHGDPKVVQRVPERRGLNNKLIMLIK